MMDAFEDGAWTGQPAYLVGGGPSLKNFDWRLLWDKPNVIVVNAAMANLPEADMFFTEDIRFIERFHAEPWYRAFVGQKVFHALDPQYEAQAFELDPGMCILRKHGGDWTRNDKYWSKSFKDGLSYSSNSMIGAMNIADIMGAEPIYLLGVDCNPIGRENANFHSLYPNDWRSFDMQLESFKSDFQWWAAPNLRHRKVVNLNPTSAVTVWERMSPEEHFAMKGTERGILPSETVRP